MPKYVHICIGLINLKTLAYAVSDFVYHVYL